MTLPNTYNHDYILTLNEFDFQKIARNPTTALTILFVIFFEVFIPIL
jgi:hypothetical protein